VLNYKKLHTCMKPNPLPPIDTLRERYRYDPLTGELHSKHQKYNRHTKEICWYGRWDIVTYTDSCGYLITGINRVQVKAHRICYALYHGVDPYPLTIDHINRNKCDNRICNLRAVTVAENNENRSAPALNGVHNRNPIRITYPDGRNTIVCDSIGTAATLLKCTSAALGRAIRRSPDNIYQHNWGRGVWAKPSGIIVTYNNNHPD